MQHLVWVPHVGGIWLNYAARNVGTWLLTKDDVLYHQWKLARRLRGSAGWEEGTWTLQIRILASFTRSLIDLRAPSADCSVFYGSCCRFECSGHNSSRVLRGFLSVWALQTHILLCFARLFIDLSAAEARSFVIYNVVQVSNRCDDRQCKCSYFVIFRRVPCRSTGFWFSFYGSERSRRNTCFMCW